jgi:hypothetical protein
MWWSEMKKAAVLSLMLVPLTACVSLNQNLSTATGTTQAMNFQAQVVNPAAVPGAPEADPVLTQAAIERYRSGEVKTGEKENEGDTVTFNLGQATGQ